MTQDEFADTTKCLECGEHEHEELLDHGICPTCKAARQYGDVALDAKAWLDTNALFVDTETTGLDNDDQVVEIAVLHRTGSVLYQSLVKPTVAIKEAAAEVHGISPAELATAPAWPEVWSQICSLVAGRLLVSHNSAFDQRMIRQTCEAHELNDIQPAAWCCTMSLLTDRNNGRWPRLSKAMDMTEVTAPNIGNAHRAIYDAECCRRIVIALAEKT